MKKNRLDLGDVNLKLIAFLIVFGLVVAGVIFINLPSGKDADQLTNPEPFIAKHGKIVSKQQLESGGITAWTVDDGSKKVVLYTTRDGRALFTGSVWDLRSGKNLSSQAAAVNSSGVLSSPPPSPSAAQVPLSGNAAAVNAAYAMEGKFSGEIPESMKTVDSLAGVKEGSGDIANTVYIIFDPRCPYCRQAYNSTRGYINKGYSIKWIPTVALGDPANGLPLAASVLQSNDKNVIERVLGHHENIFIKPTKESIDSLGRNLTFMFAAFQQNGGQQAGVPVAFFLDHRTGKSRMMTGVSESVVLQDIFGKM